MEEITNDAVNLEEVMGKLAKIRALAERGGTQHEAEVASAKMAEILLRYNLTAIELDAFSERTNRTVVHESFDFRANRWRMDLLNIVAKAHLSQAIKLNGVTPRSHHCRMTVVGHEHNLIVVRETWLWLQREVSRLANAGYKAAKAAGDWGALVSEASWKRAFELGTVRGIALSYDEMRERVKAEVEDSSSALVVINEEVQRRYDELFPSETRSTLSKVPKVTQSGFLAGVNAGRDVNLSRQVAGGSAAKDAALVG